MLNLKKGDVLRSKTGYIHKVLSVMPDDLYVMSDYDDHDVYGRTYTASEIKKFFIIPEVKWVPKLGEIYFCINSSMAPSESVWRDDAADKCRLAAGNVFETKEEANAKAEKLRAVLAE